MAPPANLPPSPPPLWFPPASETAAAPRVLAPLAPGHPCTLVAVGQPGIVAPAPPTAGDQHRAADAAGVDLVDRRGAAPAAAAHPDPVAAPATDGRGQAVLGRIDLHGAVGEAPEAADGGAGAAAGGGEHVGRHERRRRESGEGHLGAGEAAGRRRVRAAGGEAEPGVGVVMTRST